MGGLKNLVPGGSVECNVECFDTGPNSAWTLRADDWDDTGWMRQHPGQRHCRTADTLRSCGSVQSFKEGSEALKFEDELYQNRVELKKAQVELKGVKNTVVNTMAKSKAKLAKHAVDEVVKDSDQGEEVPRKGANFKPPLPLPHGKQQT